MTYSFIGDITKVARMFEPKLGKKPIEEVIEFAEYGEGGIALELLLSYIGERKISITPAEYNRLVEVSSGLDGCIPGLEFIKKFVTE